jgi:lysyl-tRNA synthetase class 1
MFQKPRTAKRLYFDIIPKTVDEYLTYLEKVPAELPAAQLENPAWHIHSGHPPAVKVPISFALLRNLAAASNAAEKETLWGFIRRYAPGATPESDPALDRLAGYAVRYFNDFERPKRAFRAPTAEERAALEALDQALAAAHASSSGAELQDIVYEVGKAHGFAERLRDWFKAIYEVLLGQSQGPRFGSFIELYGIEETRKLIAKGLAGELIA